MESRQVNRRHHTITGHGDVRLSVQDIGPLDGQPIILIHGWSQCHLAFARQTALAGEFRLIMPDLRGHGASEKPLVEEAYDNAVPWAGDIDAIIRELALDAPLLLGWSMGGWIVMDYLETHSDAALCGVALVGSSITTGRYLPEDAAKVRANNSAKAVGMYRDDLAENLEATRDFLDVCFHQKPDAETITKAMGYNMMVPPLVRASARLRQEDRRDVARKTTVPAWIAWGDHERLAPAGMGEEAVAHFPNAQKTIFKNSGHSPFWEEAENFNTELAQFARACHQKGREAA